ncbi:thiamine phosphate synthase [bacterium]|nr:thiamine phosphate synthase [candidate division CSSED10-310 bacterium]
MDLGISDLKQRGNRFRGEDGKLSNRALYLVTDSEMLGHRTMESLVSAAVRGGVGVVQLREKTCATREFIALACRIRNLLEGTGVRLLINDRVDVALAAGADGVHIGQSDMEYPDARRLLGADAIIGLSVESVEQVLESEHWNVDYLGVSPVFSTPTKTDTIATWGLDGLRWIRRTSRHPLVAIGGINVRNASDVIAAGADAIAVVSAICAAEDPESAARELYSAIYNGR